MHNEYITVRCIRDERDKLSLLKFQNIDITEMKKMLQELTLDLMDQCYNHIQKLITYNRKFNKNYIKLEPLIIEQLEDMVFIRKKFIEYFATPGPKTKADLLTYVIAFQITINYYNEYLYAVSLKSLKRDYTDKYWRDYKLDRFELDTGFESNFIIGRNTANEYDTGQVDISLTNGVNIIDKYARDIEEKLEFAKNIGTILDNYYNKDFPILNNPYNEYMLDLVDHIKVYNDFEKAKKLIRKV
jgi:hypothetical protein